MMGYEDFKTELVDGLKNYFAEKQSDLEVTLHPVQKVNCVYDGIALSGNGASMSPMVYAEKLYEHYKECGSMYEVLQEVIRILEITVNKPKIDVEMVQRNVVFQLINAEQNKEMLEGVPYHKFKDLAAVYRCVLDITRERGCTSFIVTNELADLYELNEDDLYNLAMENTIRLFPPKVEKMEDMLIEMFPKEDIPVSGMPLWILTNEQLFCGANMMLYEHLLYDISLRENADLYILPSSLHEIIAAPVVDNDYEQLRSTVKSINCGIVEKEDWLSDNVYYYNRKTGKITICGEDQR